MRGDFTGFQFGSYHTEDLGIVRVSGGDRYEEQLHPEIKDITAEVPGMDGQYFFGSTYGTKTFDLELAFDSLTEVQLRQLRQAFGTRKIERLIFDEEPYKYYLAKLESPIELSYVCFDEPKKIRYSKANNITQEENLPDGIRMINDGAGNRTLEKIDPWVYQEGTQRIYRGEGKITLICNYPFAKSVYKQLPQGKEREDWAVSSGILSADDYQEFDTYSNGTIKVYNPGDLATGFRLYIPFYTGEVQVTEDIISDGTLELKPSQELAGSQVQVIDDLGINLNVDSFEQYGNNGTKITLSENQSTLEENDELEVYYSVENYEVLIYHYNSEIGANNIILDGIVATEIVKVVNKSKTNVECTGDVTNQKIILQRNVDANHTLRVTYTTYTYNNSTTDIIVSYKSNEDADAITLSLFPLIQKSTDIGVLIDTNNNLIIGVTGVTTQGTETIYTTSGNLYNEYIQAGYLFKLEPNISVEDNATITISGLSTAQIHYDYLYF